MGEGSSHPHASHPWVEDDISEPLARRHELVSAIRRVAESAALIDVNRSDAADIHALKASCDNIASAVEGLPSLREVGGPHHASEVDRRLVERGPISGRSNAVAPPLTMSTPNGDGTIRASAVFSSLYEGPPGMVHGGVLLAAFDEVLAFGQVPSGQIGMTGTVTVKLLGPVPLNERVDFVAGTDRIDGKKIFVWAHANVDHRRVVEATAICIRPPGTEPQETSYKDSG